MPIIRTIEYSTVSELLDEIDNTSDMLKVTATMLEASLRDAGEILKSESNGVYLLLRRQADDLDFYRSALASELAEIKKGKLTVRDSKQIAEWAGVPEHVANHVVQIATGVHLGPCAPERRKPNA